MSDAPSAALPNDPDEQPDRTLSVVLSLYISNERMQTVFSNWSTTTRKEAQKSYLQTEKLRQAIDPLFNDVAMRDRNSTLDEFLIDVEGERLVERIDVTLPETFTWKTEGKTFRVRLKDGVSKRLECRMFWYVHSNGSLSYHISFKLGYEHAFSDFYFLSILQKMIFPKEFSSGSTVGDIDSGTTGVWVLDDALVSPVDGASANRPGAGKLRFWSFVRSRFCAHLNHLISAPRTEGGSKSGGLGIGFLPIIAPAHRESPDALWDLLVRPDRIDVIEVPGLMAPAVRSVFMFKDKEFHKLLQPRDRPKRILKNANYGVRLPAERNADGEIVITEAFFNWVPAKDDPDFDVKYYFLSGFFQNIIDFLNQDASEILDGTDPIYPQSDAQQEEAFFICYANGRSLFEVVERSRSFEAGADYIGICPYLFLIHLMALHNEFVIRRYEKETKDIQDEFDGPLTNFGNLQQLIHSIQNETAGGKAVPVPEINKATSRFYEFRYRAFTVFTRHLYDNTFRYDTERDIFDELLRIRGTTNRLERCKGIVEGLDKTMQDLEEDKRYREQNIIRDSDQRLQRLVLFVGLVSIMQVLFQANDAIGKLTSWSHIGWVVSAFSIVLLLATGVGLWFVVKFGRRYWLSERRRLAQLPKKGDEP